MVPEGGPRGAVEDGKVARGGRGDDIPPATVVYVGENGGRVHPGGDVGRPVGVETEVTVRMGGGGGRRLGWGFGGIRGIDVARVGDTEERVVGVEGEEVRIGVEKGREADGGRAGMGVVSRRGRRGQEEEEEEEEPHG